MSLRTSGIVRTVTGDIDSSELGATDAHEHLFLSTRTQPGDEFSDLAPAIEEARALVAAGAEALVDWTPIDLGRDLDGLRVVSEATGLHVIAATGIHADAHYAPEHPLRSEKIEALAERFSADIGGDGVRCGVIKVGASYHRLLPFEQRVFEAAALAHAGTGAPVCVHTEHGTMGLGIVERLAASGVPPSSIVLAHLDRNPDRRRACRDGLDRRLAPVRRPREDEVLARLHHRPTDRRSLRARLWRTDPARRRYRPALDVPGLRRRSRTRLSVRPLQTAARAGVGVAALTPNLRREPAAGLLARPTGNPLLAPLSGARFSRRSEAIGASERWVTSVAYHARPTTRRSTAAPAHGESRVPPLSGRHCSEPHRARSAFRSVSPR